jgi:hypothetical protein
MVMVALVTLLALIQTMQDENGRPLVMSLDGRPHANVHWRAEVGTSDGV